MKNLIVKLIALSTATIIALSSCLGERSLEKDGDQQDSSVVSTQDSLETMPDQAWCFLRLDGQKHQDSTYVYIRLKGDSVSGVHHWVPDLKDARRGVITGVKRGDTIDVVWNFMQEGISDTLSTVFVMDDGTLKQQPYAILENGRQVRDENADFEIIYKPVQCPKFE